MTAELLALVLTCAPAVHPNTMLAIVRVESGGNAVAVNVNSAAGPRSHRPRDLDAAVAIVDAAITAGDSADIGLMQINTKNLGWLRLTVRDAFDPCKNVAAGAEVLARNYQRALATHPPGQPALRAALSAYNTGSLSRGFANGYVQRFYAGAARKPITRHHAASLAAPSLVYRRTPMQNQHDPRLVTDVREARTPGAVIVLSPAEAEAMGAIQEHAISEEDAWDANAEIGQVVSGG